MENVTSGAQGVHGGGYRPLALTLTGFKGIKSGLGRDTIRLDVESLVGDAALVAIAGANGRGKTTVIDNLTPYLVMPSRAGSDGLGSFSYYDHVFLPESQKELVWEHHGRRYKTQLVLRVNGRRKTEAFLFEQQGGAWKPVVLADGTASDGKVDTYEQAVREILGPPETFFTSVFSAQGKRPLSAYRNGEIKSLLADLLGLEQVRAQGSRAAETVRLLKNGLGVIRQDQGAMAAEIGRLEIEAAVLAGAEAGVLQASAMKSAAAQALAQARTAQAAVAAQTEAATASEQRRAELKAERDRVIAEDRQAARHLDEETRRGVEARASVLLQRVSGRQRQHVERRSQLVRQRDAQRQACASAGRVVWAMRRLGLTERTVQLRAERAEAAQVLADKAEWLRGRARALRQLLDGMDREAGQVALRQVDLARRFGLAAEVPCAGTDLQGRCKLLGDAREAQALKPSVDAQIAALAERKREAQAEMTSVSDQLAPLVNVAERRNEAERRFEMAQARASRMARLAAREGEVPQAEAALAAAQTELAGLPETAPQETAEEAAERAEIAGAKERLAAERARLASVRGEALQRIEKALAALPAPFDGRRLEQSRQTVAQAELSLYDAEQAQLAAVRRQERLAALQSQIDRARVDRAAADARGVEVEQELSGWMLLAKCLSNDGVIALDIDDAGPTLAGLANDLLLACYGRRFTLEIRTQVETAKGELREGFDIVVHDADSGESKSVGLMSGGEKIWINESLTRAIALYLAGNAGREYGTLFCDESDGPLDPERKRMFMDMKREVMRLGGYEREFFVSQTPELTAMADKIIDLDALAVAPDEAL